jgi:hypothetical protein
MALDVNAYLITLFVFVSIITSLIIFYYAESGTPWHTYITVFLCYFSAFAILFMVPIDVATAIEYRRYLGSEVFPKYYGYVDHMRPMYSTLFMIVTIQSSLVLVFEEMYNADGKYDFEFALD